VTVAVEIAGVVLILLSGLALVPSAVFALECVLALLPDRERATAGRPGTSVVIVPAHDEEAGIAATLESLSRGLGEGQRILVVADNCSDRTAEIARARGAEAIEREDPERRGKGYAIVFGLDHLAPSPPDAVVIVDADCRIEGASLSTLAAVALERGLPVQADYVLAPPERPTPVSVVSGLAVLVKNVVRPRGLRRLGLPCVLTGSGMAFPWDVIRRAPPAGAYLVEDMLIGIELLRLGYPPTSTSLARVTSVLPDLDDAARTQRRRWEHGHLSTLLRYGPLLVLEGIRERSLDRLALGLDLSVPPLALLVMTLATTSAMGSCLYVLGGTPLPGVISAAGLALVGGAVLSAWAAFARRTLPLHLLLFVPLYVAWKIPLYLAFLLRRRASTWERTRR
jgi:cellulose synthase/poly-beta-1,6-N-acetylglucosamine synthase-like glycosyltransferase